MVETGVPGENHRLAASHRQTLRNDVQFVILFVGGLMSYLSYLYLFANSSVQHILCCGFCFACLHLVSCVLNFASFSG